MRTLWPSASDMLWAAKCVIRGVWNLSISFCNLKLSSDVQTVIFRWIWYGKMYSKTPKAMPLYTTATWLPSFMFKYWPDAPSSGKMCLLDISTPRHVVALEAPGTHPSHWKNIPLCFAADVFTGLSAAWNAVLPQSTSAHNAWNCKCLHDWRIVIFSYILLKRISCAMKSICTMFRCFITLQWSTASENAPLHVYPVNCLAR